MPELTKQELNFVQVIEENDTYVRVYEIESMHKGDMNDPLTTVVLTGEYVDHPVNKPSGLDLERNKR